MDEESGRRLFLNWSSEIPKQEGAGLRIDCPTTLHAAARPMGTILKRWYMRTWTLVPTSLNEARGKVFILAPAVASHLGLKLEA